MLSASACLRVHACGLHAAISFIRGAIVPSGWYCASKRRSRSGAHDVSGPSGSWCVAFASAASCSIDDVSRQWDAGDVTCSWITSTSHLPHGVRQHGQLLLDVGSGLRDGCDAVEYVHRLGVRVVTHLERPRQCLRELPVKRPAMVVRGFFFVIVALVWRVWKEKREESRGGGEMGWLPFTHNISEKPRQESDDNYWQLLLK